MRVKRAAKEQADGLDTVEAFAERWFAEVVCRNVRNPGNIRRVLDKDVLPAIGRKKLSEVTALDVLGITDRIKARGSDQMALTTRMGDSPLSIINRQSASHCLAWDSEKIGYSPRVAFSCLPASLYLSLHTRFPPGITSMSSPLPSDRL